MQCTISSNEALEELPPKDWTMGEPRFGWLGIQHVIMKLPPSWGDKMSNVGEKKKKEKTHWGEGWTRQSNMQGKVLTSPLCGACLEECLLCKYIVNLLRLLQMHNEDPEGPHGESSATCVQWCKWGLVLPPRLHLTCTARLVNQTWLHKLLLRGPRLCWGWISVHLSSPFRLL